MMKKFSIAVLVLCLLVTPYAHAKTCFGISCNYIDTNSGFQSNPPGLYWSYYNVTFPTETSCYNSVVAQIPSQGWIGRSFYVDNSYSSFNVQFRLYLPGDTNSAYDQMTLTVTNDDTGVSEVFYFNGNTINTQCGKRVISLSNDYSYHNVTVKFYTSTLTAHPWQIDDVGFFAYY